MSKLWTEQEIETAVQVFNECRKHHFGNIYRRISLAIGRTVSSVQTRHHRYGDTFNQLRPQYLWRSRKERIDVALTRREKQGIKVTSTRRETTQYVDSDYRPPLEIIEERDRAFCAGPQTIVGLLLGDPLPGRSALDQFKNGSHVPPDTGEPSGAAAGQNRQPAAAASPIPEGA